MKYLALALMLFAGSVGAKEYTLSWTNPTTYTDGSPLPLSDLASIKIYCNIVLVKSFDADLANGVFVPSTGPVDVNGRNVCVAVAVDIDGAASEDSNTAVLKPGSPGKVENFRKVN